MAAALVSQLALAFGDRVVHVVADAAYHGPALRDLPEDYRVPTVLRDVYGLPYQEIAEATGRPLGTVKVMVHRGRASLRLKLRAGGAGPEQGPAGARPRSDA